MEQSSILSAKFDWPVVRQNFSLLVTAHDCESGLYHGGKNLQTVFDLGTRLIN